MLTFIVPCCCYNDHKFNKISILQYYFAVFLEGKVIIRFGAAIFKNDRDKNRPDFVTVVPFLGLKCRL